MSPCNLNIVQRFSQTPHNQGKREESWIMKGELKPSIQQRFVGCRKIFEALQILQSTLCAGQDENCLCFLPSCIANLKACSQSLRPIFHVSPQGGNCTRDKNQTSKRQNFITDAFTNLWPGRKDSPSQTPLVYALLARLIGCYFVLLFIFFRIFPNLLVLSQF